MGVTDDYNRTKDDAWKGEHTDLPESGSANGLEHELGGSSSRAKSAPKARSKRTRDRGPSRPLGALHQKEKEIQAQDTYTQRLGPAALRASPDVHLVVRQITAAADTPRLSSHLEEQIRNEAVSLYSALRPEDAEDSMIVRQLVAVNNAAMGCLARAPAASTPQARDIELRHGIKGIKASSDLIKLRHARRSGFRQTMNVKLSVDNNGYDQVGPDEVRPRLTKTVGRIDLKLAGSTDKSVKCPKHGKGSK